MAKITLKPLDDGQKAVEIPVGKTTIGRGPFLGCGDKKVSRNHAVLEVTDQGEVYLTPTHVNPCFFQPTADNPGTILKKDKPHKLENGDSFSLLPRAFRYKLVVGDDIESGSDKSKHSPKEEEKVNGMVEEKTEMDMGESNASENPPIKEKVNGEPAFSSKEQKESVAASSGIPSRVEEHKSFDAKSNVEMNGGNSQDAVKPAPEQTSSESKEEKVEEKKDQEDKGPTELKEDEDSNSRSRRTLPDWLAETSPAAKEEDDEKKKTKPTKQHHREKATTKRKQETNSTEKRKRRAERQNSDNDERFEQRQSSGRSSRTNRQTRQGLSLEDFIASDDDEWQSDNSEPRHKKRRRSKRKDDDSGSDWEVEHKRSKKISHKFSSGSESGSDWGASSQKKKKGPKTRRRRSKRVSECDISEEEDDDKSVSSKLEKRVPCQYGKKCFRKNQSHLDRFSHPGDSDYESPAEEKEDVSGSEDSNDLPECPYGTSCFRKNPQHKKDYKHTKKVRPQREAAKQAGKKATVSQDNEEPDTYDLNDSLVNDDSDEYKPADSGSDFDSSQETSSPVKAGTKPPAKNKKAKRV